MKNQHPIYPFSLSCVLHQAQVNRPGFDPTAPPPPPPPTPADTPSVQAPQRRSSSPVFGGGDGGTSAGGVAGGGDTEAFAIEESEGEGEGGGRGGVTGGEPSSSSSFSRPGPTYGVGDKEGGAGQEEEKVGGVSLSLTEDDEPGQSDSSWQRAELGSAGGGDTGTRGGVAEGQKGTGGGSQGSDTIKMDDFLAMTETSGGGGGGGGFGGGSGGGDVVSGPSK